MPLSTSSCRGRCDANVATRRRPGRGRRAAGVRGARAPGAELVRAARGRAVRARVRVPAGRSAAATSCRRSSASPRATATSSSGSSPCARTPRGARGLRPGPARRLRPRRRRRQRVRGRRVPDDHLRRARRAARVAGSTVGAARRGGDRRAGCASSRRAAGRSTRAIAVRAARPAAAGARSRSTRDPLRRSPPALRGRLRALLGPSRRRAGDRAAHARDPARLPGAVPHVGLEPTSRIPAEALTLERLIARRTTARAACCADALLLGRGGDRGRRLGVLDADRLSGRAVAGARPRIVDAAVRSRGCSKTPRRRRPAPRAA